MRSADAEAGRGRTGSSRHPAVSDRVAIDCHVVMPPEFRLLASGVPRCCAVPRPAHSRSDPGPAPAPVCAR